LVVIAVSVYKFLMLCQHYNLL